MRERFQLPLPMWRAQFQLLGGHRRLSAILGVCAVLLIAGTVAIRRLSPGQPLPVIAGWVLTFLTGLQVLVVVLGGCNAVYRGMLRDFETKMIESHRLTPMSNTAVALGYLFGSTLQVTSLFVLFAAFGALLSFIASLPVLNWVLGNLVLLAGGLALWSAAVFAGMGPQKPFNTAPVVIGVAALSMPIAFVPGAALLFNTYTVFVAIRMLTSTGLVVVPAVVMPAAVSLVFALFWLSAAAIKYRRPDLPALNASRGLALLVWTLMIGTLGVAALGWVAGAALGSVSDPDLLPAQWIATMIGGLLLAAIAVAGAVKCRMLIARGAAARDWSDRISDLLTVVLAALLICLIMAAVGTSTWSKLLGVCAPKCWGDRVVLYAWSYSACACLLALLTVRSLFELAHTRFKSPKAFAHLVVMVLWAFPPAVDMFRAEYLREFRGGAVYSELMGCSPVGTIVATWSQLDARLGPGLVFQLVLAVALIVLAKRVRRRASSSDPLIRPAPPQVNTNSEAR
jgi:hypothetical protein